MRNVSLVNAYKRITTPQLPLRASTEDLGPADLLGNVIIIGGASRNAATRLLLDQLGSELGISQDHGDSDSGGDRLSVRGHDGTWTTIGGMPVDGTVHHVHEDFAVILRTRNPWDNDARATCLLFAGVHTYGTAAAARYFVSQWWKPRWWGRRDKVVLLRTTVRAGQIAEIERVEQLAIPRRIRRSENLGGSHDE